MSAAQVLDHSLSAPLGLLTEAVAELRAQVPADLPGPQALAETALLLREVEKLQAVVLARLADVHTRELHVLDDAPTAGVWVERQQVGLGRDRVALATKLQRIPQVALHLAEGLVSMPSAVLISRALEQVRPHLDRPDGLLDDQPAELVLTAVIVDGVRDLVATARGGFDDADPALASLTGELQRICAAPLPARARVEAAFLVLATHVQPGDLKAALGRLVDALLPLRLEDRAERAHRDRGLTLRPNGDGSGWTVRGELDLETGELLHTVVTASRATDPADPEDTLAWIAQRAQEPSAPAPRSRRQQDHDALTLALRRLLDSRRARHPGQGPAAPAGHRHPRPAPGPARSAARDRRGRDVACRRAWCSGWPATAGSPGWSCPPAAR